MASPDPWEVLGLARDASLDQARTARRRLAKVLHPDLHGEAAPAERAELAARMTLVNQALAQIEASQVEATQTGEAAGADDRGDESPSPIVAFPCGAADPDSFSMDWLPAEAFEALFLAAYGLGDILATDEPYLLELYLAEPPCFCRLTLVPEAGGSLITVEVSPASESLMSPDPAEVIAVLAAEVNALVAP